MDFESFGLDPRALRGVTALAYAEPTPIQKQAIPVVMEGRDVLGLAQTGTGKTAAFVLPLLHRLLSGQHGRLRALIITPTRELADQVEEAVRTLGQGTKISSMTIYGGVGMQPQIDGLRRGRDVVVACPGRLLDLINQGHADLRHIEVLVLDEADQMLDMGFMPDVRRILARLPQNRQNLLFSATMPDDVRRLADEILRRPVTVQVDKRAPVETVSHALYPVGAHLKTPLLKALLAHTDTESVLVFTRTKYRAKRLAQQLSAAGFSAAELQGNLSQTRRQAALGGFRDGSIQILVATDIAARGIDVSQISHVINYDIPGTVEAYTHRIGRTGRAARTGDAFTLVEPDDALMVKSIERTLGSPIPRQKLEDFDYDVPAPRKDVEFARPPREPRGPGKSGRSVVKSTQAPTPRQAAPRPAVASAQERPAQDRPRDGGRPEGRPGQAAQAGERTGRGRRGRGGQGGRDVAAVPAGASSRGERDARGEAGQGGQAGQSGRGGRPGQAAAGGLTAGSGGGRPGRGGSNDRGSRGPAADRPRPAAPAPSGRPAEARPTQPPPIAPPPSPPRERPEGDRPRIRIVTVDEGDDSWKRGE